MLHFKLVAVCCDGFNREGPLTPMVDAGISKHGHAVESLAKVHASMEPGEHHVPSVPDQVYYPRLGKGVEHHGHHEERDSHLPAEGSTTTDIVSDVSH